MNINDLHDRFLALERYYEASRHDMLEDEQYYDGSLTFNLPDNVNKIVPATGRNAVDIPSTHIVTDNPTVHRNTSSKKSQKVAADDGEVEQFILSVLQANHQLAITPPLNEVSKFQFLRGQGIIHGPFFNEEDHEDGRDDAIWFDVMDPMNVYLAPGASPREGFVFQTLTVGEMEQRAEDNPKFKSFSTAMKSTDLLTLVEWYGYQGRGKEYLYAAWTAVHTEGSYSSNALPTEFLVSPRNSGYPYLPLIGVLSGYGIRHYLPEKMIQSIYSAQVKTLLIGEAFALSVADGYMGAAAFERYRSSNPASIKMLDVKYAAGSASVIPDDVFPIEPMRIPDAVMQNYRNMSSALEVALFSGVVGGQRPVGVDTATGLAILSGQSRLKFGPPLGHLQNGAGKLGENIGRLIAHNKKIKTFRCMGQEITANQFHGDFHVQVKLYSEAPEERNARNTMGLQMATSAKGPSEKYINEKYFGIENYEADFKQKLKEKIMSGDAMKQALEQFVLGLQQMQQQAQQSTEGGINALKVVNQAASLSRANTGAGLPQQEPLPGSTEMMAAQANQQMGAGQPTMPGAPGLPVGVG